MCLGGGVLTAGVVAPGVALARAPGEGQRDDRDNHDTGQARVNSRCPRPSETAREPNPAHPGLLLCLTLQPSRHFAYPVTRIRPELLPKVVAAAAKSAEVTDATNVRRQLAGLYALHATLRTW
jgi:hypothetical protein